ncbi:MAG: diguanylate cyclase [Clostridia bacterium]|nr:diguanylate cyclase [Clostridia bacterium]
MIHDIFANVAILTAFLLVIGQIFKSYSLDIKQTLKIQVLLGIVFGILGMILMLFMIQMTQTVIIDLRNISIICASIMGGPLAAIISAVIIALFRIIYFGISHASVVAHIVALAVGIGAAYISVLKLTRRSKFICIFLLAMTVSNAALIYLIKDKTKLSETLSYYWPIYIFGAVLAYFTCEYIISANKNFKTMSYYSMTADNLLDMISTHKPDGTTIFASPSIHQLLGYTPKEFEGTSPYRFIHADDISAVEKSYKSVLTGVGFNTQIYRMKQKNGKYIWVETSIKSVKGKDGLVKEMVCVTRDITLRKQVEEELKRAKLEAEKAASTDYLTGILNRRAFLERLRVELTRVQRENSSLCLILADIDHFKNINDSYGHNFGDLVLQQFSGCLARTCRPYDFIGRHGGEEFIICLPNTTCEQALNIAERMRLSVQELQISIPDKDETIFITASFGVTNTDNVDKPVSDELINLADAAMYKAKVNGRNRVCLSCKQ